ncbi:MAG TPA: hypothetical protein VFE47_07660 [Tepidisphaeraceae bacterium]|jgi:hypothetical protein|nr:hypothetical protein [Tepidisphaeraceae bacterium]
MLAAFYSPTNYSYSFMVEFHWWAFWLFALAVGVISVVLLFIFLKRKS